MKAKQLFNLQIQSTLVNTRKPRVHKNQVTKVRRLVQPENPVHTPVVGSITETETQAIDYPIEVITDDSKYVDEEVVEQEGQKGSQEIQKIYQTIDGVKVGEPTIVSGKVIEVPQPRKIRRGSKPLDGTTTEESIVELPFKEIVQEDDSLEKGHFTGCSRRSKRSKQNHQGL